jgi:hypothetical protein
MLFSADHDRLSLQLISTIPKLAHPSIDIFSRHDSICTILAACVRSGRVDFVQELLFLDDWPDWFSDVRGDQQGLALALLAVTGDDRSIDLTQSGIRASAELLWRTLHELGCGLKGSNVHLCEFCRVQPVPTADCLTFKPFV